MVDRIAASWSVAALGHAEELDVECCGCCVLHAAPLALSVCVDYLASSQSGQ
jgi:hypothetical protein